MKHFLLLFTLCVGLAANGRQPPLKFPDAMLKTLHAGQEVKNLRIFMQLVDYRKAIRLAEVNLLNEDLSNFSIGEIRGEIEKIIHSMLRYSEVNDAPSEKLTYLTSRMTYRDLAATMRTTLERLNCHLDAEVDWSLAYKMIGMDLSVWKLIIAIPEEYDFKELLKAAKGSSTIEEATSEFAVSPFLGLFSFVKLQYCNVKSSVTELTFDNIYRTHRGVIYKPEYGNLDAPVREARLNARLKSRLPAFKTTLSKIYHPTGATEAELSEYKDIFTVMSDPKLMKSSLEAYLTRWQSELTDRNVSAFDAAAYAHQELVKIHPFTDGNGRLARLLMNISLMKKGAQPLVIENDDEYTKALEDDFEGKSSFSNYIEKLSIGANQRDEL